MMAAGSGYEGKIQARSYGWNAISVGARLPAIRATRSIRRTASSFIASKLGSYRWNAISVGAVLARDLGDAVYQTYRVIVHPEQGGAPPRSILQRSWSSVGAGLAREPGDAVYQTHRVIVHREQARSYRRAPKPVGAVLARDTGDAVYQAYRVIAHREQALRWTSGSGIMPLHFKSGR